MLVPTAQLKAFQPLDAFPPRERARWRRYVDDVGGLTRAEMAQLESGAAMTRLLTGRARPGPRAALVRRMGSRTLVCPLELDLRAGLALASFERSLPHAILDAFLPAGAHRDRLTELAATGRTPHVLDGAWVVPLHWFVAFDPRERRFSDPPEGSGARVVYLTTAAQAADRLERVIRAVEEHTEDGEDILVALAELSVWVEAFDPVAVLELDYGGVAGTMSRVELESDETCAELWRAVEALEESDALAVAAAYGTAVARWRQRRARQYAS